MVKLGVLDYAPIDEGATAWSALQASTRLVQAADRLNYSRFWVSEHHGIEAMASVSPEVLIAHLAGATSRIRVGSGGVMLPHYSSVKVAENFKTLETLNPGRIDLGFGRAPGANGQLSAALNDEKSGLRPYPKKVADLLGFVTGHHASSSQYAGVAATPDGGTLPLPWVLGASGSTAELAAANGIGFTFAHFINPSGRGVKAVEQYKREFRPSAFLTEPAVIAAVFVAVGQNEAEAKDLEDAFHLWLARAESAFPFPRIPSLERTRHHSWSAAELAARERNQGRVLAGTATQVAEAIRALAHNYGTEEIMVNPMMPGENRRLAALESLAAELALQESAVFSQP
ncbi:luciferase family oxidoreductase group 1 [Paenarthrobacter nicotinovorans]|uniref:MsnO8 family LLM class oxidoreductase n=1 Tax=Micrococcaceae TaxID=1268 RepID=UPI00087705D2|nr:MULTISPECIES: MsnO8 family LLM class oxidoreductase [Micrococcaceae]MDR6438721.1 luciferase family oxidoreductase group 1 [Paenarthrobacter nicotinovorans]SCZ56477.1 luciferase family oxidoreductase, group 1 [Arthrobacter sp. UNCCL28]